MITNIYPAQVPRAGENPAVFVDYPIAKGHAWAVRLRKPEWNSKCYVNMSDLAGDGSLPRSQFKTKSISINIYIL